MPVITITLRDDQIARIRRNAQSYVDLKEGYLLAARERPDDRR